jgi:hypothetical protein
MCRRNISDAVMYVNWRSVKLQSRTASRSIRAARFVILVFGLLLKHQSGVAGFCESVVLSSRMRAMLSN